MPRNIKLVISLLVVVVGVAAFHLESNAARPDVGWATLGLTALMILGMWVFPETGGKKDGQA